MLSGPVPAGLPLDVEEASQPGLITSSGLVLFGSDGKAVTLTHTHTHKHKGLAEQLCLYLDALKVLFVMIEHVS